MSLFDKCNQFTAAQEIRDAGLYPYFHHLESRPDTVVQMEGQRRIMLGSNNYLGLTVHPEVIEAAAKALEKYGTGCSGSRFLNGTLDLHLELEAEIAKFMSDGHTDPIAALTFSTGFMTNLSIISSITDRHDTILCDRENHASIYDGCRLSFAKLQRYRHSDMEDLERQLEKLPYEMGKLIVTDGVFSMSGDIAKLPEIVALAKKYNAAVMVDDAHGFGVIGKGGRGTASYFGLEDDVDITMSTFSKSLASLGGFITAKPYIIDYVQHTARPFMFAASIPPSTTASALAALKIIEREPERVERLATLSKYMRAGLAKREIAMKDNGGVNTPIVPIYTYEPEPTLVRAKQLYENGVYVNPVLPPAAPEGECLLRTSLMATHTEDLLDEAMDIIAKIMKS